VIDPLASDHSHGTDLLGQRYAYDLVRTDHRTGFHLHPAGTLRWLLVGGGRGTATAGDGRSMPPWTAWSSRPWTAWLSASGSSWCGSPGWR
jgi:hypothetical protein